MENKITNTIHWAKGFVNYLKLLLNSKEKNYKDIIHALKSASNYIQEIYNAAKNS